MVEMDLGAGGRPASGQLVTVNLEDVVGVFKSVKGQYDFMTTSGKMHLPDYQFVTQAWLEELSLGAEK
jgi:hypothetical protein